MYCCNAWDTALFAPSWVRAVRAGSLGVTLVIKNATSPMMPIPKPTTVTSTKANRSSLIKVSSSFAFLRRWAGHLIFSFKNLTIGTAFGWQVPSRAGASNTLRPLQLGYVSGSARSPKYGTEGCSLVHWEDANVFPYCKQ